MRSANSDRQRRLERIYRRREDELIAKDRNRTCLNWTCGLGCAILVIGALILMLGGCIASVIIK